MINLDIRTLNFCIVITNTFFCIAFYVFWRTQKTYNGFGYWVASAFILTSAYLFYQLRGIIPDGISILLGNGFVLTTTVLRLDGIKRFYRNEGCSKYFYYSILLFLPIIGYFYFIHDNIVVRTCFLSFSAGFVILCFCRYYYTDYFQTRNPLSLEIGLITTVYVGIFWVRAFNWINHPEDYRTIFEPTKINELFYSYGIITDIGTNLIFLMLHSQRLAKDLGTVNDQLFELASHDPLTGVYSRRTFIEISTKLMKEYQETGRPLNIMMLDLDYFKLLNDEFGHTAGDKALNKFASICRDQLPSNAIFGRVGGDEFAIVLPDTDITKAKEIANKLRTTVENTFLYEKASSHKITVSIGIKELTKDEKSLDDLLHTVDMSLYVAKKQGRNRVKTSQEESPISIL